MKYLYYWPLALLICSWSGLVGVCANSTDNYQKWEGEISAFERSDATNPPPQHGILFIGSSTIRFWKTLAQDFPDKPVINRGFGGSEICDSTHFADRIVFPYAPRQIVFRAGGNDLWDGKTPREVFEDYKKFVELVEKKQPGTKITFISWNPTIARWSQRDKEYAFNRLVKRYSFWHRHLQYVETADMVLGADGLPRADLLRADHLHFDAAGYQLLTQRVRPYLD